VHWEAQVILTFRFALNETPVFTRISSHFCLKMHVNAGVSSPQRTSFSLPESDEKPAAQKRVFLHN
jgi:hypothetical protein